ncbi:hypothetical protein LDENG_00130040 [Lucifuga dentata]|nr:hypothetical protein LDENG_00130040 [Lucifuga dentata]
MRWEMNVSNVTCMKIKYIRLKHAKWPVWSFNCSPAKNQSLKTNSTGNTDISMYQITLLSSFFMVTKSRDFSE